MTATKLSTLSNTASIDEVVEIIQRDGGVIISDFVTSELLEKFAAEMKPYLASTPTGLEDYFVGTKTRRIGRIIARSDAGVEIAMNPTFVGAAKKILQTPTHVWFGVDRVELEPDIQLSITQLIQIGPGQGAQPLHRDDATALWRHPNYGREARVQVMIAVTDFTEENGATRVIPGSHLWDDERMPTVEETTAAEMKSGSALLWLGSTYHGGGTNSTDSPRTGFTAAYDLALLRQEENQYLSIPVSRVRELPEEMQRLLGWTRSQTYQGWVEIDGQMSDPLDVLNIPGFNEIGKGF
jgi:ectoine hydroxylase-related dioxygenase (phytanoyl-CoA dioxygenase family)